MRNQGLVPNTQTFNIIIPIFAAAGEGTWHSNARIFLSDKSDDENQAIQFPVNILTEII